MARVAYDPVEQGSVVERNAGRVRGVTTSARPKPSPNAERGLQCYVNLNGVDCLALFDSGSTMSGVSQGVVDVAKIPSFALEPPLTLQLGCVGSRSKINFGANTTMSVGALKNEKVYLDIVNLDRYDVVIGTPFMHDYGVVLDFEKGAVKINGAWVPALKGGEGEPVVKKVSRPNARKMEDGKKEKNMNADIMSGVPSVLPPLRAINHRIPLVEERKRYNYYSPRCPESMRLQLKEKLIQYEDAGWWVRNTTEQAAPMMCIPK
ncbi:hypothetical protein PENSPDRAFT_595105, partial [Peniophora sp. CONT]